MTNGYNENDDNESSRDDDDDDTVNINLKLLVFDKDGKMREVKTQDEKRI